MGWLAKLRPLYGVLLAVLLFSGWVQPAMAQWGTTDLPTVGSEAPSFSLLDNDGTMRQLKEFRGQWVVLYFYPKDFTSGCTIEARRFQQDLPKFQALHTQVLGISADSVESHAKFCNQEGLKFPLLSDPAGSVSRQYGSWLGEMALRNSFLIDPNGVLREIFPIVHPPQHSAEVLSQLAELQRA